MILRNLLICNGFVRLLLGSIAGCDLQYAEPPSIGEISFIALMVIACGNAQWLGGGSRKAQLIDEVSVTITKNMIGEAIVPHVQFTTGAPHDHI